MDDQLCAYAGGMAAIGENNNCGHQDLNACNGVGSGFPEPVMYTTAMRPKLMPFLNRRWKRGRTRVEPQFDQLVNEDKNYRTVLSTAAALGASVESARIGKIALWVAVGSMAVAAVTLIVTEHGGHSLLAMLADCVGQLFSWFVGLVEWSPKSDPAVHALLAACD